MTADRLRKGTDPGGEAGDEVAPVLFGRARLRSTDVMPRGIDAADALQIGPLGAIGEDGRRGDEPIGARFDPPVIFLPGVSVSQEARAQKTVFSGPCAKSTTRRACSHR